MAEDPGQQQITLVDKDVKKTVYDVLFTFKSEDFNRSYIFIYPAGKKDNEQVNVEAYALPKGDDPSNPQGGQLEAIQTDKEWDMVESVLHTFLHDDDKNNTDDQDKKK